MLVRIVIPMLLLPVCAQSQLFEQDFNSSSVLTDYVSAAPGSSKFNSISSSGAGVVASINVGQLRFVRSGANTGSFTRNTDLSGPPASLMVSFDLSVTGTTTAATSVCAFYIGNNFSTTNTTEANADVFARFSINTTTTDGNFVLRDITNGTNSSTLSGTVAILWVINNGASAINYKAPDGTIASIGTDKADIWGNTSILFNDVSVQTGSQVIADIKFIINQGSQTVDIDNMLIDPIPPATISSSASNVAANSFTANWTAASSGNGYRLDVSKNNDFSTFVAGYEGLSINGNSTTSANVTGLLWGNTYYYRVRSMSAYSTGEFESDHSNVTNVVTGILPLHFTILEGEARGEQALIRFRNENEDDIGNYYLERTMQDGKFRTIQTIFPKNGTQEIIDTAPSTVHNLYRIAAVYKNESKEYSRIIAVKIERKPVFRILKNPTVSVLNVLTENATDTDYEVTIFALSGELLYRKKVRFRKGMLLTIPVHTFQHGAYLLHLKGVVQFSEWFVVGGG